jgi:hypothetical protein
VANIFQYIRVKGDGVDALKDYDGTGLFLSTKRHNRSAPVIVTSDGAIGAAKAFTAIFTIDFALNKKWNLRPADTFLDTRVFKTLNLEAQFSANIKDALLTGCDRTESAPAATITVVGEYETPHSNFGAVRLYRQWKESIPVSAASSGLGYQPAVDRLYKEFIVSAQNKAAGGQFTGNDALIVKITLKMNSSTYIIDKVPFKLQQYLDALDYNWAAIHAGAQFLDFDTDGMLTEILSTLGANNLNFSFDVTLPAGTNEIWVYPGVIEPYPDALRRKVCVPAATAPLAVAR